VRLDYVGLVGPRLFAIPGDLKPFWPLFDYQEAMNFRFYANDRHYVYAICYPGGLPFYIGRGHRQRVMQHVSELRNIPFERWKEKHHEINSLMLANSAEMYAFLALVDDREQAAAIERKLVKRLGIRKRGGLLVNSVIPDGSEHPEELQVSPLEIAGLKPVRKPKPNSVYHPDLMIKDCGYSTQWTCGVCRQECWVPRDLTAKVVQCPNCAHFFVPLSEGWTPARHNFNLCD
jgi:hypothetical protein